MATRRFYARQRETDMLLRGIERLRPDQAQRIAATYLTIPGERRAELRRLAREALRFAHPLVREAWSNARAYASDAVRHAAHNAGVRHYTLIGNDAAVPWGATRAAARDAAAAWAVRPHLPPQLAAELVAPLAHQFRYLA